MTRSNNKQCGHEFESILSSITSKNPQWCSYCSNPPKQLCDKECNKCFSKSFASHPKSKFWHLDNNVDPRYGVRTVLINDYAKRNVIYVSLNLSSLILNQNFGIQIIK